MNVSFVTISRRLSQGVALLTFCPLQHYLMQCLRVLYAVFIVDVKPT